MAQLTRPQIENLVNQFYSRVRNDELLSYVFDDVVQVDWDHHLPLLCQFWTSILLKTNEYQGNTFAKHVELAKKVNISEVHFQRWLKLFEEDALKTHPPEAAAEIISRAHSSANVLRRGMGVGDNSHQFL